MKTTLILLQAALMMALFSSCSKERTEVTAEPIPAGEFYIKANVNGQPFFAANNVDGIKLNGNFSAGFSAGNSAVSASGTELTGGATGTAKSAYVVISDTLAAHITSLAGKKLPFCTFNINGTPVNPRGVMVRINEYKSHMALNNAATAENTAEIISVSAYTRGHYGLSLTHSYFKVSLRFTCKAAASASPVPVSDGEAVILVTRPK
jgi:hypothetical protein